MSEPIVVEALSKRIEFRDLDALQEHVDAILEQRGGVFSPTELACFRALAAHANGDTPPEVARTIRATSIYTPPKAERGPSPLGDRITDAEEVLAKREADRVEALDRRAELQVAAEAEYRAAAAKADGSAGAEYALSDLRGRLAARQREAELDYVTANEATVRARARLNALRMAAERWHRSREARYHNAENPSQPLTAEQLAERLANNR